MNTFLRTFLLTALIAGIACGIYFGRGNGTGYAVWSGAVGGVLIGFIVAVIARYRENRVADSPPVLEDEVVVHDGRAIHNGMAGWLYLTDKRVVFEGYPTDEISPEISTLFERFPAGAEAAHQVSIPVLQIASSSHRSVGIDLSLDLVLTDGRTLNFGTEDPVRWIDEISISRQKYLDAPRSEDMKLFP